MFHEGMTMIKLRRPMLLGEPDDFMETLTSALGVLGIMPGDEFGIVRVSPERPSDASDQRATA